MADEMRQEIIGNLVMSFVAQLNDAGLDDDWEIERLKKEADAPGKPVTIKLKGAINPKELEGKPWNVVGITGVVEKRYDKHGQLEEWYGDGETLLELPMDDMKIQQTARQDVQKLKGRFIEIKAHHVEIPQINEMLNAIIASLPDDYAGRVRLALSQLVSGE